MRSSLCALLVVLFAAIGCARAPAPHRPAVVPPPPAAEITDPLDRPLPLDPQLTKKTLRNGVTYYVLPNQKPAKRAQLWLVVNAGSVLENDDERGYAHFVEHMAFAGTRRFPHRAIEDLLERSGARVGADLNAMTSFDETIYRLQIPTDDAALVERAVTVLREWAEGLTFEPAAVDRVRPVVIEEWRLGLGAWQRLFDLQAPVLFAGSVYAERAPIGRPEALQQASPESLQRFYRTWYRPELMAVIAVGDFDRATMASTIERELSSIPPSANPRPRPRPSVPPHLGTLVSVETNPEMPRTAISISRTLPPLPERTEREYRRVTAERLYGTMLASRLDAKRLEHDAPFWDAEAGIGRPLRATKVYVQTATVKPDGVERGLAALLAEVERVERTGFIPAELERAKAALALRYEHHFRERASRDNASLASEISRNFLVDEPMTGAATELAMVSRYLPECTLLEVQGACQLLASGSRVVTVAGPTTMAKPSVRAIAALVKEVDMRPAEPYVEAATAGQLMASAPAQPGRVVETRAIPEIGVTEWKLANGVRVVVKPTTLAEDSISMSAFAPGGTSLASDSDFPSAYFADELVGNAGAGPFGSVALQRLLAGRRASAAVRINALETTFRVGRRSRIWKRCSS